MQVRRLTLSPEDEDSMFLWDVGMHDVTKIKSNWHRRENL
jgi:hypothetical protein